MGIAATRSEPATGCDNATARGFGATIEMTRGSLALCLVATTGSPLPAINAVGAKVLAALSPTRVIAVVDMTRFGQLQRRPDILMAGPISVDPQRFARFQQILGATTD